MWSSRFGMTETWFVVATAPRLFNPLSVNLRYNTLCDSGSEVYAGNLAAGLTETGETSPVSSAWTETLLRLEQTKHFPVL